MQTTHANHPSVKMIAAFDRGDWPGIIELVAPNARAYIGSSEIDRDGWKQFGQMWAAAFPDTRHEILAVHVAGEYATVVCRLRATHKGAFMGVPASGRAVTMEIIHVDRVVDGRIVEHRGQFDSAGLMQQLSVPVDHKPFIDELFTQIDAKQFSIVKDKMTPTTQFIMGGKPMDRDGWAGFSQMFFGAFPDGKHHNDTILSFGNRALAIGHFTGTHRGNFQGIPATGRSIDFTYLALATVEGDKVSEMRVEGDFATMMQQLTS